MFVRPIFHTSDMLAQHLLLDEVADLVDAGVIRTTLERTWAKIMLQLLKRPCNG